MFELPTKTDDRVAVLNHLRDSASQYENIRRVQWLINHYWLRGIRDYSVNWADGSVAVKLYNRQTDSGRLALKYESLVSALQKELGRLYRMNTRPMAERKGHGLDGVRKATAARVTLDYLTSPWDQECLKREVIKMATIYGTVGIGVWTQQDKGVGPGPMDSVTPRTSPEVIPPWQLFPIPFDPDTRQDLEGIGRKRWVPLKWLKDHKKLSLPGNDDKLGVRTSPWGINPGSSSGIGMIMQTDDQADATHFQGQLRGPTKDPNTAVKFVLAEEYWFLQEERDRLARYIMKVGDHLAFESPQDKGAMFPRETYCPVGISRYHPVGGFWGRSFVEILLPINAEQEEMAQNLFQNIKDLDLYGVNMIPATWGVPKDALTKRTRRRKFITWEPDYAAPEVKPHQITPATTGDFPGKVLAMAQQMQDKLSIQGDILEGEAPGRVDSEAGLSFLSSQSAIPLSVPASEIAAGFTQIYKALLSAAPVLIQAGEGTVPLISLDDSLIGLKLTEDRSGVELHAAAIPKPSEVEIGIKDELPTNPAVRKKELMLMRDKGIMGDSEFRITCWRDNIDLPVANWAEQASYQKAVLQVLTLFGDGKTPGEVTYSGEADMPAIHLMVIQALMARVEYQFASKEVREGFEELKRVYLALAGKEFPEGMPGPTEAAEEQKQMQGAQPGAGPGMPAPMPM